MARDEAGFTMVEMLVVVVLIGIIVTANALFLTTALKVNVQTTTGVAGARLTELTVAYFNDDMQQAKSAGVPDLGDPLRPICGPVPLDRQIIQIIGSGTSEVNYVTRLDAGGTNTTQLHRLSCDYLDAATITGDVTLDTLWSSDPGTLWLSDPGAVIANRDQGAAILNPCATPPTIGTTSCELVITPCPSSSNWPLNCTGATPVPLLSENKWYQVTGTTRTTS